MIVEIGPKSLPVSMGRFEFYASREPFQPIFKATRGAIPGEFFLDLPWFTLVFTDTRRTAAYFKEKYPAE